MEPISTKSTALVSDTQLSSKLQADNTNTVLLGAIAGAGLLAAPAAAETPAFDFGSLHLDSGVSHMSLAASTVLQSVDGRSIVPMFDSPMAVQEGGKALNNTSVHEVSMAQQSLAGHAAAEVPAASQLPAGNDVPVASQAADASSFATGDVAMPSLEALMATVGQQGANAQGAGDVAQVLADALAGGGGADIDGLLASLPGSGGNAVDALATHAMASVSAWDMGAFGGFTAVHQAFTMEALVLHQDAVVQQA
jgi:hypothetical protein